MWFPPRKIPLEDGTTKLLPVLVITAAHSRFVTGRMIPTRKTEDLLLGSWELIPQCVCGPTPLTAGAAPRRPRRPQALAVGRAHGAEQPVARGHLHYFFLNSRGLKQH